ncbi:helix-turn-helix transcriptional regulator [Algibacter sp. PT7-4]|uniref:helix-turn-helix transcriptional regulator n=1 Tax=Algibacter ulvanivorans TaxID=3400999 RepID=UPI003AAF7227
MINFISINLIYTRKANHLSQTEMGEKIGTTSHSISAYERNKALPGIETIQQLCSEFGYTIDEFVNKDLSKIKKNNNDSFVKKTESLHIIDKKTESLYNKLIANYEQQLVLKNELLKEKDQTIAVKEREVVMLEVIINQNAIEKETPLLDKISTLIKIQAEIKAAQKEKETTKN